MKKYKVVVADITAKRAVCKEYDFKLSGSSCSDQQFILDHYASLGWKLVQVERGSAIGTFF